MRYFGVLFAVCLGLVSCQEVPETTSPARTTLTVSIYASAKIIPEDYYLVYPTTAGVIENWFVEVGDTVLQGQLIAQIKNDNSELQVESAELNSELAAELYKGKSNMLKSIQTEILATKRQLIKDSLNHARQANLIAKKVGSLSDFETIELQYDLTKNRLINLEQRLAQSKMELKNSYLQAQKNLKVALTQLGDFGVRSIMDGKIFDVRSKKGELVSLQQPIAAIGKGNSFIIEMWVDEQDISNVRLGQKLFVSLDAYPANAFEGFVTKMYPQKNEQNQSFKIEGKFLNNDKQLFAGLSGEASIVLSERENILIIPQSYLVNDTTVLTETGAQIINTGERNMSHVEIVSGITEETVIITPPVE